MELIYPQTGETLQANAGPRSGGNYIRGPFQPEPGPPGASTPFPGFTFPGTRARGLGILSRVLGGGFFPHRLRPGKNEPTPLFDELVRRLRRTWGRFPRAAPL
ncbi:MAG: hypothetical protein CM1200mP34_2060 [Verrucomicrobiales bacterium]|nr:MAG: hypothetical protein CM1200mP34_2060 [Verrucomicrobiales bacterium]